MAMTVRSTLTATAAICAVLALAPCRAVAGKKVLGDEILSRVSGQVGISVAADMSVQIAADAIKISDRSTTRSWLELRGFSIDDGAGNSFSLRTATDAPSTIDVATDATGRSMLVLSDTSRVNPRYYSAQALLFAGQELGSLRIGPVTEGPATLRMAAHGDGTQGVDFDYLTRLDIGSFQYRYNTALAALNLTGVHFFGSATGNPADNPADPASWVMSGSLKIGDIATNPATFDLATDTYGKAMAALNLPLQGSLRIEDMNFGGTSFGPAAIDGINVHRLQMRFMP